MIFAPAYIATSCDQKQLHIAGLHQSQLYVAGLHQPPLCFCCHITTLLLLLPAATMNADRLHFTVSAYTGSYASLRSLLTLYRLHACLPSNMLLDLTGLPQDYFQCSARHLWCWVPAQEPDCVLLCFAIGSHKQGGTKSAATRTVHGILKLVRQTI